MVLFFHFPFFCIYILFQWLYGHYVKLLQFQYYPLYKNKPQTTYQIVRYS